MALKKTERNAALPTETMDSDSIPYMNSIGDNLSDGARGAPSPAAGGTVTPPPPPPPGSEAPTRSPCPPVEVRQGRPTRDPPPHCPRTVAPPRAS